jgi:hypothetical protein
MKSIIETLGTVETTIFTVKMTVFAVETATTLFIESVTKLFKPKFSNCGSTKRI